MIQLSPKSMRMSIDPCHLCRDDLPDLVDDEGQIVDAAVTDGPEETREARMSFLTPLSQVRMMWPPLIPPPAFPEPLPLQRLSGMQVSPPTDPDEEGEHMTDVENPVPWKIRVILYSRLKSRCE